MTWHQTIFKIWFANQDKNRFQCVVDSSCPNTKTSRSKTASHLCILTRICVRFSTNFCPSSKQVWKLKPAEPEGELLQQPGSCRGLFNRNQHGLNHTAAKIYDLWRKIKIQAAANLWCCHKKKPNCLIERMSCADFKYKLFFFIFSCRHIWIVDIH